MTTAQDFKEERHRNGFWTTRDFISDLNSPVRMDELRIICSVYISNGKLGFSKIVFVVVEISFI